VSELALSIDIGSTWTKGILVDIRERRVIHREATPTTVENLVTGFNRVYEALGGQREKPQVFVSSSAKGGLTIAAIGLVPDLTLKAAKMAAASAGGKVIASFAYKLTQADIGTLEKLKSDIILLSGGTDGGDETYVLHNARMLAASSVGSFILYAGNQAVREPVLDILRRFGKEASATANILPDLDSVQVDEARKAIGDIFLKRIIEGRGLSTVRDICSADPRPTPAAVYDLVGLLEDNDEGLLVLDMGGATTDVYTVSDPYSEQSNRIFRGLPETRLKRTVEGDLGLRVSAAFVAETGLSYIRRSLDEGRQSAFKAWVERIRGNTGILPSTEEEQQFDDMLAVICVAESIARHGGTLTPSFTPEGLVWIQQGKDLARVHRIIGSGGRLAQESSINIIRTALEGYFPAEKDTNRNSWPQVQRLLPHFNELVYERDRDYIIPLAANLALAYPELAKALVLQSLQREYIHD
jgi:uncharacterized protein (TIGR01319 family)